MTMSVKMLNDIAVHAEGLASEAMAIPVCVLGRLGSTGGTRRC